MDRFRVRVRFRMRVMNWWRLVNGDRRWVFMSWRRLVNWAR